MASKCLHRPLCRIVSLQASGPAEASKNGLFADLLSAGDCGGVVRLAQHSNTDGTFAGISCSLDVTSTGCTRMWRLLRQCYADGLVVLELLMR